MDLLTSNPGVRWVKPQLLSFLLLELEFTKYLQIRKYFVSQLEALKIIFNIRLKRTMPILLLCKQVIGSTLLRIQTI